MKKITFFLVFASLTCLFSCTSSPEKKMVGIWKMESVEITNAADIIAKKIADANIPDSLQAKIDSVKNIAETTLAKVAENLKKVEIIINEDKTISFKGPNSERKGTWAMALDGKSFTTTFEGDANNAIHTIDEQTDSKITCTVDMYGEITKYTMTKK